MPAQRIAIGLVGPSSHTAEVHQSAKTVNLYLESNDPDAKEVSALYACPGLLSYADVSSYVTAGSPKIRGLHRMGSRLFAQASNALLEVRGAADFHQFASLPTFSGSVAFSDNNGKLIVGDGTGFYVLDFDAGTFDPLLTTEGDQILGTFSGRLDQRTIYVERGTGRFYYSALNDPATVEDLNFATAEGDPDATVAMVIANREVVFLGEHSIEYWTVSEDADNPLQRIPGGFSAHGCVARWSAKLFENSTVWVGQNDDGHGVVWRAGAAGSPPARISNHAVEKDLRTALLFHDAEEISAYTYTEPGHSFYVLNLPNDKTWAYDVTTGLWHERAHVDAESGQFTRIRQQYHAFWQGEHYVGVWDAAKLYKQSRAYSTNDTDPLVRLRETPHVYIQGRWMRFNALEIEMQVGLNLEATQDLDPQLMLQYSDDGGLTWSNEITRSIGKLGETRKRVRFGPLGRARDRVFRISVSDNAPVVFVGAWADVEVEA